MTNLEVWASIVHTLTTEIPGCNVYRCYDVLTELTDIAYDTVPRIYVQLDGIESTPIGSGGALHTIEDVGTYTIHLVWKTRTSDVSEYDSLLPLLEKISVALRYKTISTNSDSFAILNSSYGTDGDLFDKDVLTDDGIFLSTIGIQTKSRRTINGC